MVTKQITAKLRKSPRFGKLPAQLQVDITLVTGSMQLPQQSATAADVVVYKGSTCGGCKGWVKHRRENGFSVEVYDRSDVNPVKRQLGVPRRIQSCHTAKVSNCVIEGQVPANDINHLLNDKLDVAGLIAPGMPRDPPAGKDLVKTPMMY